MFMSRFLTLLFITFSVISLAACAFNPIKLTANNNLESLSFTTLANANQNSATAIDVVFIADTDVIEQMPTTGAAWFSQRSASHYIANPKTVSFQNIRQLQPFYNKAKKT